MQQLVAVLKRLLPPLATFVLVVAVWDLTVVALDLKPYLLPRPHQVLASAREQAPALLPALALTGAAALGGLALGLAVGTAIALVFSQSPLIRSGCYPYAVFLQTVPIVAIAPLLISWFGVGFQTVVLVSFIICLFPIIANVTAGLLSARPSLHDLFRLYGASRWQVLWKLQAPTAVPALVTGARTSSGLAVIGAIVGEFFAGFGGGAGAHAGLGNLILQWQASLMTGPLMAAVLASTLLGVAIFAAVSLLGGRLAQRWSGGD